MTMNISPAPTSSSDYNALDSPRPNPEVRERAKRRQFTTDYRLAILREADTCTEHGQLGALLRREGLYSSHLADWRRQRDKGARAALAQKRGRKPADPVQVENAKLRRETERLTKQLKAAQMVIDVQGNVYALLGIALESAALESGEAR